MIAKLLGAILEAQSLPREAQEAPKTSKNGAQNVKKSKLQNKSFSDSIFSSILCVFFQVFSMIFKSKNAVKLPKTILAKTSKIVLPSRRNADFQEIEVTKNKNYKAQIDEKSCIFWDIDFKSFWVGFGMVLGAPKPWFLQFFRSKIDDKKGMMFWKAPEGLQNQKNLEKVVLIKFDCSPRRGRFLPISLVGG